MAARVSSLAAGPLALAGHLQVQPTACGVVAALSCAEDAERLLTADLSGLLGEPVHVTRLVGCKRTVLLPDVPRAIPVRDITAALQKQGISALSVERHRHLVHVEDVAQSNALLRDGLDFFGAVRFRAVSERAGAGYWWRRDAAVTGTTTSPPTPSPRAGEHPEGGGRGAVDVLQCYRCQVKPFSSPRCPSRALPHRPLSIPPHVLSRGSGTWRGTAGTSPAACAAGSPTPWSSARGRGTTPSAATVRVRGEKRSERSVSTS
ncbi:hypothetical protein FOCC_FOCC015378 [Frankliniella occidentalis]|nr:hypothetical protein FOCC_FOCC015378 [Frankliniella occidentalis]